MSLKRCTFEVIIPSLCRGSTTDEPPEDINKLQKIRKQHFRIMCVETQYSLQKTFRFFRRCFLLLKGSLFDLQWSFTSDISVPIMSQGSSSSLLWVYWLCPVIHDLSYSYLPCTSQRFQCCISTVLEARELPVEYSRCLSDYVRHDVVIMLYKITVFVFTSSICRWLSGWHVACMLTVCWRIQCSWNLEPVRMRWKHSARWEWSVNVLVPDVCAMAASMNLRSGWWIW